MAATSNTLHHKILFDSNDDKLYLLGLGNWNYVRPAVHSFLGNVSQIGGKDQGFRCKCEVLDDGQPMKDNFGMDGYAAEIALNKQVLERPGSVQGLTNEMLKVMHHLNLTQEEIEYSLGQARMAIANKLELRTDAEYQATFGDGITRKTIEYAVHERAEITPPQNYATPDSAEAIYYPPRPYTDIGAGNVSKREPATADSRAKAAQEFIDNNVRVIAPSGKRARVVNVEITFLPTGGQSSDLRGEALEEALRFKKELESAGFTASVEQKPRPGEAQHHPTVVVVLRSPDRAADLADRLRQKQSISAERQAMIANSVSAPSRFNLRSFFSGSHRDSDGGAVPPR